MTISVWRYSHLALAVSSFLLLTLAALTGIILAFQPVSEKLQPYKVDHFEQINLAQTLPVLRKIYPGITEITVDNNQFILAKGSYDGGKKLLAYIDPLTGKILGTPKPKSEFFQWVTDFHRSLFLHGLGRIFMGVTAFLLLLITISGTILIVKRQRGVKRFFTKISRDHFAQFYHVVLGRWSLVIILIIALSGTYLSMSRFGLVNTVIKKTNVDIDHLKEDPAVAAKDIPVFKNTKLADVATVEFPFSEFPEDYYTLKLKDREVAVNQFTGEVVSEVKYPIAVIYTDLSLTLHTGRGSSIWALVLAVASANILFFIYSGFAITWKRISGRSKNKYKADDSEFIILVGSENGSTYRFADAVHQQLLKAGKKSFVTELNNYQFFPKAQQLVVFTATYGLGDAPTNATKLASLVQKYPQAQGIKYSVLGFGSHAYTDFCQFAFEVNQLLSAQDWATPIIDIHTVNDRSPQDFNLWAEAWSQKTDIQLSTDVIASGPPKDLQKLTVTANTGVTEARQTFTIKLQARKTKVQSGDLLAIYPKNDHRERLYSIGVVDGEIQLSVRLHLEGIGSNFLYDLEVGRTMRAKIVANPHFYFPKQAPAVVMIANGTGIAPFLGMIDENVQNRPCYLYAGFRERLSVEPYQPLLDAALNSGKLTGLKVALSREADKNYVSDVLALDSTLIAGTLDSGGVVMICGSLAMQKDVLKLLENVVATHNKKSLSYYQSHSQILMDCY